MVDNRLVEFPPYSKHEIRKLGRGLEWYVEEEYLTGELLGVTPAEIDSYRQACTELFDMLERAAQHVITHRRWSELGIPANAVRIIEYTWANRRRYPMLYGRFDLAGVLDGEPAKLIEFNADTATVLPETIDIQAAQLSRAGLSPDRQFNLLFEHLRQRFASIRELQPERAPEMLITTLGHPEDQLNAYTLADAAQRAGFYTQVIALPDIVFSSEDGIFVEMNPGEYQPFDFLFKLVPWEFLAWEEPRLMDIFTELCLREKAVILNPAYTMLFQSKGMMKILWELFPGHPYLLETAATAKSFRNRPFVEKVIFGREGENIQIMDDTGRRQAGNDGDFGHFPRVYQAYTTLPRDSDGNVYQAGIYYTGQASALSFRRRDGLIIDADAEFVGHYLI